MHPSVAEFHEKCAELKRREEMKIAVHVNVLDQIGPYDYRTSTRTKVFDSETATIEQILKWAKTHGENIKVHDLVLSHVEA